MNASIQAIEYHLPSNMLDNAMLASLFPDWPAAKIRAKTGILERRIAGPNECASDLAVAAAQKLFAQGACHQEEVDYVLLCTQSPDYPLPTTACLIQDRLGLPKTCGALDFNLGCSGYIYGLGLAKGLIETGQARRVLLLTTDTYSKYIHPGDRSVRSIFGDGAAATLVVGNVGPAAIGPFIYGTDGSGAANLIVRAGGARQRIASEAPAEMDANGNTRTANDLYMNGPEIFSFTLRAVPEAVRALLNKADKRQDEVDLWVFHQANEYMLEHLRKKLGISPDRFALAMEHSGNTVSASIPIALSSLARDGKIVRGMLLGLVGFGVGYSWGATLVRW